MDIRRRQLGSIVQPNSSRVIFPHPTRDGRGLPTRGAGSNVWRLDRNWVRNCSQMGTCFTDYGIIGRNSLQIFAGILPKSGLTTGLRRTLRVGTIPRFQHTACGERSTGT